MVTRRKLTLSEDATASPIRKSPRKSVNQADHVSRHKKRKASEFNLEESTEKDPPSKVAKVEAHPESRNASSIASDCEDNTKSGFKSKRFYSGQKGAYVNPVDRLQPFVNLTPLRMVSTRCNSISSTSKEKLTPKLKSRMSPTRARSVDSGKQRSLSRRSNLSTSDVLNMVDVISPVKKVGIEDEDESSRDSIESSEVVLAENQQAEVSNGGRKFFKSSHRRLSFDNSSVVTSKGFMMKYTPRSMKKQPLKSKSTGKKKSTSKITPSKTHVYTPLEFVSDENMTDVENKGSVLRRSPRKKTPSFRVLENGFKTNEDVKQNLQKSPEKKSKRTETVSKAPTPMKNHTYTGVDELRRSPRKKSVIDNSPRKSLKDSSKSMNSPRSNSPRKALTASQVKSSNRQNSLLQNSPRKSLTDSTKAMNRMKRNSPRKASTDSPQSKSMNSQRKISSPTKRSAKENKIMKKSGTLPLKTTVTGNPLMNKNTMSPVIKLSRHQGDSGVSSSCSGQSSAASMRSTIVGSGDDMFGFLYDWSDDEEDKKDAKKDEDTDGGDVDAGSMDTDAGTREGREDEADKSDEENDWDVEKIFDAIKDAGSDAAKAGDVMNDEEEAGVADDDKENAEDEDEAGDEMSCVAADSVAMVSDTESEDYPLITNKGDATSVVNKLFPIFSPQVSPAAGVVPKFASHIQRGSSLSPATPKHSIKRWDSPKNSPTLSKIIKDKDGKEQLIIDVGQKRIGATQCAVCGMVYSVGEPHDEATHARFHQRLPGILRFQGWKKERVIHEYEDGSRIIMILPEDTYASKKVNAVKGIVDEDLGFVESAATVKSNTKVFFYVSGEKKISGFCLAEVISQGYRVIGEADETIETEDDRRPFCCSTQPEQARCGINRIWVFRNARRQGVASKLLDCVRVNFVEGYPLAAEELAFSDPTPNGKMFAAKYTGTPNFLVYKIC